MGQEGLFRRGMPANPTDEIPLSDFLDLARIGSQLFAFGSAICDQTAAPPLLDIFATRLSAQPLRQFRKDSAC